MSGYVRGNAAARGIYQNRKRVEESTIRLSAFKSSLVGFDVTGGVERTDADWGLSPSPQNSNNLINYPQEPPVALDLTGGRFQLLRDLREPQSAMRYGIVDAAGNKPTWAVSVVATRDDVEIARFVAESEAGVGGDNNFIFIIDSDSQIPPVIEGTDLVFRLTVTHNGIDIRAITFIPGFEFIARIQARGYRT